MKARKTVKEKRNFWTAVLAVLCVVILIGCGVGYVVSLRSDLMEQTISDVLAVTQQQQQAFDTFISGDRERLHSFATYFSQADSRDEEGIQEKLKAFSEVDANYTVVNLENGNFYNSRSDETYRMDGEVLEFYRALDGADVRDPYVSLYSEKLEFGYYERFVFEDGVPGLFQKGYDCSRVSEEFSLSFYDGQGLGYVVTQNGDVLLRSVGKSGDYSFDNIFDLLTENSSNQLNIDSFIQKLESKEAGTVVLDAGEGKYIYSYVPVQNAEDWYLISIVPLSAVMEEADAIIRNSQATFLILLIILLVFMTFLFVIWFSHKEIKEKDYEIEYRKQQFDILSTYLSNNTDDVYVMLNADGFRAEYVSSNIERVLGVSRKAVMEDITAFGHAKYTSGEEISFERLKKLKPGDSIRTVLCERVHKTSGEHKWFRESVYCVSLHGESKIMAYLSDRTKERRTQDTLSQALDMAQVANKAKTAFLGNVSHDIRTPMNAIMGLVTLLEQEADNPERVLEYTQRINAASQHLLGLINDVLDMNKIEGGGMALNITEINMSELIDELNVMIRPQTKMKKQSFKIFASSFNYEHLLGDKLRLNQILINILSNAVKYTPDGGTIEMHVNELPQIMNEYSRIQFVIRDNGQGMSEEYLKVIFNPFTREQNSTTNKIQGTGLGMAITKSLVDLMGGSLKVESAVGKGSVFTLELELRIEEAQDDSGFWKKNRVERMIVADDDEYTCRNIVQAMADTGVEIEYTTSGKEVVEMMRNARENGHPYDLLLLDWKMPDLNGLDAARLIRKNYPERIPILFFTSYDWSEIEQEALEVGVDHFLPKPFFMYSFKEAIKRVMNGKKNGRESVKKEKEKSVVDGKHILIVDDIEVNRMILVKILESLGAFCDTAENGQEAAERFVKSAPGEYDIILMDVQMPVMNGYEATKAIRASSHPEAEAIAIIAMTANAFVDDVKEALDSGMDAHVSKPVVLQQLKTTLQEVLERKGQ